MNSCCKQFVTITALLLYVALSYATEIHDAVNNNDVESISALLDDDPTLLNARDEGGLTPLNLASFNGNVEVVLILLERGADITIGDMDNSRPIHCAAISGNIQVAELLLNKGAPVNDRDDNGTTPLGFAVGFWHVDMARYLIDQGADPNIRNEKGMTPLFAVNGPNSTEIARLLIENGAQVNIKDGENNTPLHTIASTGSVETVKVLVDNGALVNVTDQNGMTPLHSAVNNSNIEIVDYLIRKGACLNLKDEKYGRTELHTAVIKGQKDLVERLIQEGAKTDIQDTDGKNPLDYARYHGFGHIAQLLETNNAPATKHTTLTSNILKNKKIKEKEAIVWHLGHSGWAIKTQHHLLIFDYFKNPNRVLPIDASLASGYVIPSEIKDENVTVFASHHHYDHYDPRIFEWRSEIPDIQYVLGFRPNDIDQEYTYTEPRSEQEIGSLRVCTIRSNDAGVGFLIEVDGLTIFHAGDHANGRMDMSGDYTPEIDALATMSEDIDLAFFAIFDASLGTPESEQLGVHYAIEHLKPKALFPMHASRAPYFYREFVEDAADRNYDSHLAYALNEGDRFFYRQGKIIKIE